MRGPPSAGALRAARNESRGAKRRPASIRRVAILSSAARPRELMRRLMRHFGYAPLVFADLDEFLAAGGGEIPELEMLLLGDLPGTDFRRDAAAVRELLALHPALPLLHAPMERRARPLERDPSDFRTAVAMPRYFGQLYGAMQAFLRQHGFAIDERALRWAPYAFDPEALAVRFADQQVSLDPVAFDLALEFFMYAGRTLSPVWLRRMLPADERGANWHRIDNLACTVDDLRFALQLDTEGGWRLAQSDDEAGYLLRRPVVPKPAASKAKRAALSGPARIE